MKTEQPNYNLYASRNLKLPEGVDFSLIPTHNRYILILTDKTPPDGFTLVPESTPLTDEEKAWKSECLRKNEHADEYTELLTDFCNSLEQALKTEQEKLSANDKDKKG